jgi:glyceraldehyde-3-phosphate dehydrogenase/erythrose-4-phosphate dehydrogenase
MAIRVAINGFGRIGRALLRAGWERSDVEFVHVNDLTSKEMLTHLLKHDTIHGPWNHDVKVVENGFLADGRTVPIGVVQPFSWQCAELFNVRSRRIAQIEVVLNRVPYRMPSNWS